MTRHAAAGLALLTGSAALGCKHESSVVGKWTMHPTFKVGGGTRASFMTGFSSTFWYLLKPDRKFEGAMTSGMYAINGTAVTITTTKVGQNLLPSPQPMNGELGADRAKLMLHLAPASITALESLLPSEFHGAIPMVGAKTD